MIRTVACVTALVIAAGAASAQEDDPARMSARVDRPNVRRMFEDLRKTPRIERTPVARAVQAGSTQTSVWMLGGVIDRAVLVWFEITPGSEQAVAQTGAITVTREQDITHHSIFKNR